jgi:hypothetical protein
LEVFDWTTGADFLGAGFSSSDEESDELLACFLAAFEGAATGFACAFLGAGF